jgi:hypothetical protein
MTSDTLDKLFRDAIRARAETRGRCELCGDMDLSTIQTSHIFPRANIATRWDFKNAYGVCNMCHRTVESMGRVDKEKFYIAQMGFKEFRELRLKSASVAKFYASDLMEIAENIRITKENFEKGII